MYKRLIFAHLTKKKKTIHGPGISIASSIRVCVGGAGYKVNIKEQSVHSTYRL